MKVPKIYYGLLAVFCLTVLCFGIASAAGTAQAQGQRAHAMGAAHPGFDMTNVTMQQQMITRFQQQGVDVTGLQAAFQSGDMTAVKTWMEAHRPNQPLGNNTDGLHRGFDLTNATMQQQMIARFQQQGVDVTGLQAAFQSGDMTAVRTWMEAHRPAQTGLGNKDGQHRGFDLTNVTLQQQMIARFQQQGVDVTGLQAAFQSGDMTALRTWMEAHRPAQTGLGRTESR
jgi:N-acyl-L-homoserine lactone synthetase